MRSRSLGVGPVAGVGDDTITQLQRGDAPDYGGETYTSIGVVSNGYLVVGGGTGGDIVFLPQHFPNAARPNNVIAPIWSDLNPSAAGAGRLYVANLSARHEPLDGRRLGGRQELRQRHDPFVRDLDRHHGVRHGREQVTIAPYGPGGNAGSGDPDSGVNWGAENRDGSSGANIAAAPANGSEFLVHTTPPAAGGSVSIPFDIASKYTGTFHSDASMTSSTTPGTSVAPVTLTVTP